MTLSRLTLPVTLLLPLISAAVGAGGAYAVTRSDVSFLKEETSAAKIEVRALSQESASHHTEIRVINTKLDYQTQALERIERHLGTVR